MIRGRGSIRKDKEAEVRGKPGWEHVFNETLHVVIEVSDAIDDADAARILTRAKEMVELLLVPVPEERDTLKRQQLRDLAILNGTFRANDGGNNAGVVGLGPVGQNGPGGNNGPHATPYALHSSHSARTAQIMAGGSVREFGVPPGSMIAHSANSNIENQALGQSEAVLSRRRTAPLGSPTGLNSNSVNFASGASHISVSSSPSLSRHNSVVGVDGEAGLAGFGTMRNVVNSRKPSALKAGSASRSESYLPDISALRIPSLDIEAMNESFLVSPMLAPHGMPGPSPTIVDPDMYPFPSTPSVLSEHPGSSAPFGSPIWSGSSVTQGASSILPATSPVEGIGSPPLPSPPLRSPHEPGEGATSSGKNGPLPSMVLGGNMQEAAKAGSPLGDSAQSFTGGRSKSSAGAEPGVSIGLTYPQSNGAFQTQHRRIGTPREHLPRGNLFEHTLSDEPADDASYGTAAFANYFPKVTGVQAAGPKDGKTTSHGIDYTHSK